MNKRQILFKVFQYSLFCFAVIFLTILAMIDDLIQKGHIHEQ